jgi:hypothetical protein
MDVTTHTIVLGPVPTGQPNAKLMAYGPGPAGSVVYASGGSGLVACSPTTLAVQGSAALPSLPFVWTNGSQMNLSAGGSEWLLDLWNPATSQQELWVMTAATLQTGFVMPTATGSSTAATTVLRSGTLRKAYARTGPTTLVPIPTDPIGAPLPPITLPFAGTVISN